MINREITIDKIEFRQGFIYKGVTWKKIPFLWNSWKVPEYLGDQRPKTELVPLVKCQPKIGGSFQMSLAKFFNVETVVEPFKIYEHENIEV